MKKKTHQYMTKGEKALYKIYEAQEDAKHQMSHRKYRVGGNKKVKVL